VNRPHSIPHAGLRPESATHFGLCLLSLLVGLGVIWIVVRTASGPPLNYAPLLPCASIFLTLALGEWLVRVHRQLPLPELARAQLRPLERGRVGLRLFGFITTLLLVAAAYWLFPEYAGTFYTPYWRFLATLAPLGALVPIYFIWADTRAQQSEDEFVQFGRVLIGQWRKVEPATIKRHLLGWTVKAYFLPLMAVYLSNEYSTLASLLHSLGVQALLRFDAWFHLSFMIDLLFCVIGYTATCRLFDSHMRSVEPTMLGWVVALLCYQPFYSVIGRFYLQYEGSVYWDTWLGPWPALRDAAASAIIALSLIYALSTVAFGLRFSNLTHRGIITSGPYRYTKHPAYIAKNLSWWLISVPFAADQGWSVALRHCALLLLLNCVYYLRARTEERHLSRDPAYIAYGEWINEHGLFSSLGRVLPWLRYRAPHA
jgi:protein-S-isoprenylcysteine O-methyltransferase Ste14